MGIRASDKHLERISLAAVEGGWGGRREMGTGKPVGSCCRDPGKNCSFLNKLPLAWISVMAFYLYVILIHFPLQIYF